MENHTQSRTKHSGFIVHEVLAHSYLVYFSAVLLGFITDMVNPIRFNFAYIYIVGALLIVFGTALIYWAQHSASKSSDERGDTMQDLCLADFCVGPYKITRTPTHFGLFLLAVGLSFLYGSFVLVVASLVAFIITRFIFIPLEEKHLEKRYGTIYKEYKEHVPF